MQAAGQCLRAGGPWNPVPRAGHPGWLRRAVPRLPSPVFRMLRPDGKPQCPGAQQPLPRFGPDRPADRARLPRSQRMGVAVSQGERGVRAHMSESPAKTRTIKVDYLARVEGEGALFVKMKGDQVTDVKLKIFEPPRLFEAFLRGRHFSEVPDITARICGICPIAYQMSSVHAIERALGIV